MKKKMILGLYLLFLSHTAFADFQTTFETLRKRHGIPADQLSLSIVRFDQEKPKNLLEVNAKALKTPASVTKILTAIAAFENIPRNHTFVTEFKALRRPVNGVLKGDIYLVGSGDPSLVTEKLWQLVHDLSRWNIHTIEGNLIYDDTIFDEIKFSPTRSTKNHRAYSAPTSGLTFNWNALWVRVLPQGIGQKARVYLDPPDPTIQIQNSTKTTKGSTRLLVDRVTSDQKDHIIANGKIDVDDEFSVYRSHTQPSLRAAIQVLEFFKGKGIHLKGKMIHGKTPEEAVQLAKSESASIEEIIKLMMKFSNNLIAEMLVKYMDHLQTNQPGNLQKGLEIMNQTLKKHTDQKFTIVNPSGLTQDNKVSAQMMTDLLIDMSHNPEYGPEFLASFPRSGIDGTIKKRMLSAVGRVRAKTGLLNGVVGLSGYIYSQEKHLYAFAFIYNGPVKKQGRATDLFDLLAERVALKY